MASVPCWSCMTWLLDGWKCILANPGKKHLSLMLMPNTAFTAVLFRSTCFRALGRLAESAFLLVSR